MQSDTRTWVSPKEGGRQGTEAFLWLNLPVSLHQLHLPGDTAKDQTHRDNDQEWKPQAATVRSHAHKSLTCWQVSQKVLGELEHCIPGTGLTGHQGMCRRTCRLQRPPADPGLQVVCVGCGRARGAVAESTANPTNSPQSFVDTALGSSDSHSRFWALVWVPHTSFDSFTKE